MWNTPECGEGSNKHNQPQQGYVFRLQAVCQEQRRQQRHVHARVHAVSGPVHGFLVEVHQHTALHHLRHAVLQSRGYSKFLGFHSQRPLDLLLLREQTLLSVNRNRGKNWNTIERDQCPHGCNNDGRRTTQTHLAWNSGSVANHQREGVSLPHGEGTLVDINASFH